MATLYIDLTDAVVNSIGVTIKTLHMASSYTIGDHFEGFIKSLLQSGRYASASEVIRDSLRLLEERERLREAKLEALRRDIAEGLASGPSEEFDLETFKREARAERAKKRASSP